MGIRTLLGRLFERPSQRHQRLLGELSRNNTRMRELSGSIAARGQMIDERAANQVTILEATWSLYEIEKADFNAHEIKAKRLGRKLGLTEEQALAYGETTARKHVRAA